jgi:hypothetical protein
VYSNSFGVLNIIFRFVLTCRKDTLTSTSVSPSTSTADSNAGDMHFIDVEFKTFAATSMAPNLQKGRI